MKYANFLRLGLFAPIMLTVAACGGGVGGVGGGDRYAAVSPIQGVTSEDIADRTGAGNRQTVSLANAAAVGLTDSNPDGRFTKGEITFRDSQLLDDDSIRDQAVTASFDTNGDGTIDTDVDSRDDTFSSNFNPDDNPPLEATGEPRIQVTNMTLGGENVVRAADVPGYNTQTVVYVPADADQSMYAGMFLYSQESHANSGGAIGHFGIKTTNAELSAQGGQANYSGIASATVARSPGPAGGEGGFYEGNAGGQVDFDHNTVALSASLTRERDLPGASGTDTITVTTNSTFAADGGISGTASYGNLIVGENTPGTTEGQFYGPNGETLGLVFIGTDPDASIAGGMLLNRTDD